MDEAQEPERKKYSLLFSCTKVGSEKALLCQELLCTVEQDCYSPYVQVSQIRDVFIVAFYHLSTLGFSKTILILIFMFYDLILQLIKHSLPVTNTLFDKLTAV